MTTFLTILAFATLNRLRGYDPSDHTPTTINHILGQATNKFVTSFLCGAALYYSYDIYTCAIVAMGILIWATRGWGDYFDFTSTNNNETKIIDHLTRKITSAKVKDTVAMSLRGLYILPLSIALAIYHESFQPLYAAPLILLQGPIYYLSLSYIKNHLYGYKHALAEFLTGALIGIMVIIALQ